MKYCKNCGTATNQVFCSEKCVKEYESKLLEQKEESSKKLDEMEKQMKERDVKSFLAVWFEKLL